jgi:hypothetical protein
MSKWVKNLQSPHFPVEIWNHRDGEELTINLRVGVNGQWESKEIASFKPEDEDYKIVLHLWWRQRDLICGRVRKYGVIDKKKWWEIWK